MLNHEPLSENREEKGGTQGNVNEEERRKGTEKRRRINNRRERKWRMENEKKREGNWITSWKEDIVYILWVWWFEQTMKLKSGPHPKIGMLYVQVHTWATVYVQCTCKCTIAWLWTLKGSKGYCTQGNIIRKLCNTKLSHANTVATCQKK